MSKSAYSIVKDLVDAARPMRGVRLYTAERRDFVKLKDYFSRMSQNGSNEDNMKFLHDPLIRVTTLLTEDIDENFQDFQFLSDLVELVEEELSLRGCNGL